VETLPGAFVHRDVLDVHIGEHVDSTGERGLELGVVDVLGVAEKVGAQVEVVVGVDVHLVPDRSERRRREQQRGEHGSGDQFAARTWHVERGPQSAAVVGRRAVCGGVAGLQRRPMRPNVVIGHHEVLDEQLPVPRAVEVGRRHHHAVAEPERGQDFAKRFELGRQGPGRRIERHEHEPLPHLDRERRQLTRRGVKALSPIHHGCGAQVSLLVVAREVVRPGQQPPTARLGHQRHRAVKTDVAERPQHAELVAGQHDRLAPQLDR
jgi:hypothetical protein